MRRIVTLVALLLFGGVAAIAIEMLRSGSSGHKQVLRIDGIVYDIASQGVGERSFANPVVAEVGRIGADGSLIAPARIRGTADGTAYVMDADLKVKQFDQSGAFVRDYGAGAGEGPGEFFSITDFSLGLEMNVLIADVNARKVSVFDRRGDLLATTKVSEGPYRITATPDGGFFIMSAWAPDSLFRRYNAHGTVHNSFGRVLEDQRSAYMAATGNIVSVAGGLVFVPSLYGFIVRYDANGNVVFVRRTMDDAPPPELSIESSGSSGVRRFKSRTYLNYSVSLVDSNLFVQAVEASKTAGRTILDVYSLSDGSYEESWLLPQRFRDVHVAGSYLFALADTVAIIFKYN